jgi:hypothetical protein
MITRMRIMMIYWKRKRIKETAGKFVFWKMTATTEKAAEKPTDKGIKSYYKNKIEVFLLNIYE